MLAYFDRSGTSNRPTEAINGRLEHLCGSALGFRNLTHYIARSLLGTGGFRPQLHPGTRCAGKAWTPPTSSRSCASTWPPTPRLRSARLHRPAGWGAAPGNFRRDSGWTATVGKLGVPGLHFHDLRHTGNTLAAPGASLADLKARMGHDSARAAMIYQHATAAADRAIADALDRQIGASGQG